jgi:hypothetical protein
MPHPNKKQRLTGDDASLAEPMTDRMIVAAAGCLSSVDVLANIFGFLDIEDVMRQRGVNKRWKEAVKNTTVPLKSCFYVDSTVRYNAMRVMTDALPNLQQITLDDPDELDEYKYNDGEDPDEEKAARTANWTTHDIEIISNFGKLRDLQIYGAPLNGRYPFIFNSFPLLEKLEINCHHLKWDLNMLAGLPLLKELNCEYNYRLTGNINSLGVLKDTLEKVFIEYCPGVEGNFMDLADFHNLKDLVLECTAVTGDIRDIGENDFSSLEDLNLPEGVYGGRGSKLQRISDAPDLVRAVYLFGKQRPALSMLKYWYGRLSEDSPDWYESAADLKYPPFNVRFVKAGSRIGYRWETDRYYGIAGTSRVCEVNWLDPEPNRESNNYGQYIEEMQEIDSEVKMYKGFHQPPTIEEYDRLLEEYEQSSPEASPTFTLDSDSDE